MQNRQIRKRIIKKTIPNERKRTWQISQHLPSHPKFKQSPSQKNKQLQTITNPTTPQIPTTQSPHLPRNPNKTTRILHQKNRHAPTSPDKKPLTRIIKEKQFLTNPKPKRHNDLKSLLIKRQVAIIIYIREVRLKRNQDLIKQKERKETVQRMWRIQEYHKA